MSLRSVVPHLLLVAVVLLTGALGATQRKQLHQALEGQQIWRLVGDSLASVLQPLIATYHGLDLLQEGGRSLGGRPEVTVRVEGDVREELKRKLEEGGVGVEVMVQDVAQYLRHHDTAEAQRPSLRSVEEECTALNCPVPLTDSYMTFQQIEWYLRAVNASQYPRVELSSMGTTEEGRTLWLVKLSPYLSAGGSRRAATAERDTVWVDGGTHAREWISPATGLHLLHNLATSDCGSHSDVTFYFAPAVNPDGYDYSWTDNRMWRKNRAANSGARSTDCQGVDLNRNFDYMFGVGASDHPCSNTFMGPHAFSEPETKAISDELSKLKNLKLVLTLHSHGQSLLYPWGWTNRPIKDADRLVVAGNAFAAAARATTGAAYSVTNSGGGLYLASGATDDWAKKKLAVPYSYTLELRDLGKHGFVLSAAEIKPSAEEVTAGFMAMLDSIRNSTK